MPHRRDDDAHLIAGAHGGDDALCHSLDPFGVPHRGSAVLLNYQCHELHGSKQYEPGARTQLTLRGASGVRGAPKKD